MKRFYFILLTALITAGCGTNNMRVVSIDRTIDSLRSAFAPDPRTAVFSITAREEGKKIILSGETDNLNAKEAVFAGISPLTSKHLVDSVVVLPDPSLGGKIYGIVDVSVGNVRATPKYQAELVNQVLLGHIVRVLKKSHGWYYIKSEDNYLGWIEPGNIVLVDSGSLSSYTETPKLIVTSVFSSMSTLPGNSGNTVSDLVMADLLKPVGKSGPAFEVQLPDGRVGYVPSSSVQDLEKYYAAHKPTPEGIESVAKEFLGFPYLWGGTSAKGVDCSGFTKTVFRMNGIRLPRDASQQVNTGESIDPGTDFQNLRKGDLLFFGQKAADGKPEKIVHVAIYLGNGYFIHSSDRVRISGLLKSDSAFDQYDLNRFVRAKRILTTQQAPEKAND